MDPLDFIFPHRCFGCGMAGGYLCPECVKKAKPSRRLCPECGRTSVTGRTHNKCRRPLGLDGLVSIWKHTGPIRDTIVSLKYKFAKDIAGELADYAGVYLTKNRTGLPSDPVLIPIPLFWLRGHWRGFNQGEEIGKRLALRMKWDFNPRLLERKLARAPQVELRGRERTKNVRGVFRVSKLFPLSKLQPVVLFDDVWTTGSTLKEAARILKRGGVRQVWGLTISRS